MNSTSHHPRRVSGTGIAGHTLGYWPGHYGFEVTVVKVAPERPPGGHANDVRGPGLEAAERMGIAATPQAADVNYYSLSQVRMSGWSRGRVSLVGEAGHRVCLDTGQATSVTLAGAYVLAGELTAHEDSLRADALRDRDITLEQNAQPPTALGESGGEVPDYGDLTVRSPSTTTRIW